MKTPIRYEHISYEGDLFYDADGNELNTKQVVDELNRLASDLTTTNSALAAPSAEHRLSKSEEAASRPAGCISDAAFVRYEAEYERVLYMEKSTEMFGSEHQRMARRAMIEMAVADAALPETSQEVHDTLIDAERYRWFRDECTSGQRVEIAEIAELADRRDLLDHFIDKGRCGL